MSRATLPLKVGVVMAVAAFAIGLTASNALAWPNEQPAPTPQHGDKDNNKHKGDKGDERGGGQGREAEAPAEAADPAPRPAEPRQPR